MLIARREYDIDNALIDPWSGIHAASGLCLDLLNVSNNNCIYLAILWEVIENSVSGALIWRFAGWDNYNGDSMTNIISDIIFVVCFCKIGRGLRKRRGVGVLIIICCLIYYKIYSMYLEKM